jgi:hypothetical protein
MREKVRQGAWILSVKKYQNSIYGQPLSTFSFIPSFFCRKKMLYQFFVKRKIKTSLFMAKKGYFKDLF